MKSGVNRFQYSIVSCWALTALLAATATPASSQVMNFDQKPTAAPPPAGTTAPVAPSTSITAPTTPAASTSAPTTPAASTSAATTPAASTSAATTPAASTTAATTPASTAPASVAPAQITPEAKAAPQGAGNASAAVPTEGTQQAPEATPAAVAPPKPKLPDNEPPKEMPAAMKLFSAGKYALAQKQFETFINSGVADEATHMNLAYCLYYQRKYTAALKQFDWVNKNAKHSISMQMKAQATAAAIRSCMRGICPGQCLKPSDPRWQALPSAGDGKWIKWTVGGGAWKAFSEHHMGDVIQMVGGMPTDMGTCPICGGTGTVTPLKDGAALPGG